MGSRVDPLPTRFTNIAPPYSTNGHSRALTKTFLYRGRRSEKNGGATRPSGSARTLGWRGHGDLITPRRCHERWQCPGTPYAIGPPAATTTRAAIQRHGTGHGTGRGARRIAGADRDAIGRCHGTCHGHATALVPAATQRQHAQQRHVRRHLRIRRRRRWCRRRGRRRHGRSPVRRRVPPQCHVAVS